jgi:exopolyphosphatase/pppGpp-phosphohydrolase
MLRLGAAIAADGLIPPETCERAVDAARRLGRAAERAGAEEVLAIATAALRDAKNGRKLAEQLGRALDTDVRILSGQEEARLIFSAFRRRVGLGDEPALGLDLGGGSLELMVGNAAVLRFEETLRRGVARLHGELKPSDPMTGSEARALRERVESALAPHVDQILASSPRAASPPVAPRALGRSCSKRRTARSRLLVSPTCSKASAEAAPLDHGERSTWSASTRRAPADGRDHPRDAGEMLGLQGMMIGDRVREGVIAGVRRARDQEGPPRWRCPACLATGVREGMILQAVARRARDAKRKSPAAAG